MGVAATTAGHTGRDGDLGQTQQLPSGRLTLLEQTCTHETRGVTGAGGPGPPHGVVSCPCPGLQPKALKSGWRLRRGKPQPRTGRQAQSR